MPKTSLFDDIVKQTWDKILNSAANLLLPRISIISILISNKLNKRSSLFIGNGSSSRLKRLGTTRQEFVRVLEWCCKFRDSFERTEKVLPPTLNGPFNNLLGVYDFFLLDSQSLKNMYYAIWNKVNEFQLPKLYATNNSDTHALGDEYERMMHERELILRVLICKNEYKFVKNKLEIEERFRRCIKTEADVGKSFAAAI
ncbi:unnamed protein product [Ambrosiozyma monospora]|uniref:Unnamed protein product n=1 Tax=Ambrosiozyma monospora TaxID=43982 RepID=A0ACB5T562_AMBMO|nr:unnamed protein product [Ambrosiozyma monospora]